MHDESAAAMNDAVLERVLASRGLSVSDVTDLGGFESFVYRCEGRNSILRATHGAHRDREQLLAEVEWIAGLAESGGAVSKPIRADDGELVTTVGDFHVCEFGIAPGRPIERQDWSESLFQSWGAAIGLFHAHAKHFSPTHRRQHWLDDANFFLDVAIGHDQPRIEERMKAVHEQLRLLPEEKTTFGLVHCDAHAGNFFLHGDRLTFFDFDDACYAWFGYDAATVLFSAIRQDWMASTRDAEVGEAERFLPAFLEGYARHADPQGLLPSAWPLFLKLREISLFSVILTHLPPADRSTGYASRFMDGRRERIEAGEPYLEVDFTRFF